ncbi:C2H2-type zinc finger protein NDAI_0C06260 [Naumovozyma dairenensis CBS 421]|uniref:C2H2-type domain-containing protein n=1 Tax=Naumovozyma dairenensis (strain ATCC 10597 / BCRC 20456 / CBS 421 / NBRC 0211 / NRRL Y-12639) TaxID=1071378 RepID=G0W924_NAUDC|nr:hypothetical protein NDAI_0C06260 [Naumovozyma dairenensis CBS 421]CCD24285.1 hypothetical protein NDAI_0C06260 [Naumovozyma dairenensis CBS 421]
MTLSNTHGHTAHNVQLSKSENGNISSLIPVTDYLNRAEVDHTVGNSKSSLSYILSSPSDTKRMRDTIPESEHDSDLHVHAFVLRNILNSPPVDENKIKLEDIRQYHGDSLVTTDLKRSGCEPVTPQKEKCLSSILEAKENYNGPSSNTLPSSSTTNDYPKRSDKTKDNTINQHIPSVASLLRQTLGTSKTSDLSPSNYAPVNNRMTKNNAVDDVKHSINNLSLPNIYEVVNGNSGITIGTSTSNILAQQHKNIGKNGSIYGPSQPPAPLPPPVPFIIGTNYNPYGIYSNSKVNPNPSQLPYSIMAPSRYEPYNNRLGVCQAADFARPPLPTTFSPSSLPSQLNCQFIPQASISSIIPYSSSLVHDTNGMFYGNSNDGVNHHKNISDNAHSGINGNVHSSGNGNGNGNGNIHGNCNIYGNLHIHINTSPSPRYQLNEGLYSKENIPVKGKMATNSVDMKPIKLEQPMIEIRANNDDDVGEEKSGRVRRRKSRQCHICGKSVTRTSTLQTHMLVHTGDRPFECVWSGCHKRFNVKSNMNRHYKLHLKKQLANEVLADTTQKKELGSLHDDIDVADEYHAKNEND